MINCWLLTYINKCKTMIFGQTTFNTFLEKPDVDEDTWDFALFRLSHHILLLHCSKADSRLGITKKSFKYSDKDSSQILLELPSEVCSVSVKTVLRSCFFVAAQGK